MVRVNAKSAVEVVAVAIFFILLLIVCMVKSAADRKMTSHRSEQPRCFPWLTYRRYMYYLAILNIVYCPLLELVSFYHVSRLFFLRGVIVKAAASYPVYWTTSLLSSRSLQCGLTHFFLGSRIFDMRTQRSVVYMETILYTVFVARDLYLSPGYRPFFAVMQGFQSVSALVGGMLLLHYGMQRRSAKYRSANSEDPLDSDEQTDDSESGSEDEWSGPASASDEDSEAVNLVGAHGQQSIELTSLKQPSIAHRLP